MITLVITLFSIALIEFAIFLILEFTNMRTTKKLNDEHDKLNSNCSRDICNDSDICESGNKELNEREKA